MSSTQASVRNPSKPRLLFFYSATDGRARRIEGYLAQVLQRRGNHETFVTHRVEAATRPDLLERFRINELPTLLVVDDRTLRGRLEKPRGAKHITDFLQPWLQ